MAKYLIDTDILITVLRTGKDFSELIGRFVSEDDVLSISVVTVAELYAGASAQKIREQNKIDELCSSFIVIPVSSTLAKQAGKIKFKSKIPLDDALIAASAIAADFVLVTKNIKDFQKVRGLKILP